MISRERILEAAGRVYAKHGFRGATTRLIANEAGVNEVTLFRTFGSKGALLEAVLQQHHENMPEVVLDANADDLEKELTGWIHTHIEKVRSIRPLLIHSMGEMDERPEAQEFACRGRRIVHDVVTRFVSALKARGAAAPDTDEDTAAVILVATIQSDAIARSFVPDVYPPVEEAPGRYAKSFLRMIGCHGDAAVPARKSRGKA
jgi:AcrR family transcriptional regulator